MADEHVTDFPFGSTQQKRPTLRSSAFSKVNICPSKCGPRPPPRPSPIKKQYLQPSFNHLINTFE